jgi:hypothetical protein
MERTLNSLVEIRKWHLLKSVASDSFLHFGLFPNFRRFHTFQALSYISGTFIHFGHVSSLCAAL